MVWVGFLFSERWVKVYADGKEQWAGRNWCKKMGNFRNLSLEDKRDLEQKSVGFAFDFVKKGKIGHISMNGSCFVGFVFGSIFL